MKKFIVIVAISVAALAGCSSQTQPTPTVTITEQLPPPPSVDDGVVTNSQQFIDFVRDNGGMYGRVAQDSDILDLGRTICEGFDNGLSEDQMTYVIAQALIENGMNNDDGIQLGAALIVGAKNYLCGPYV